MTALAKYQRLECDAVWRAASHAQRQNVFVSLGDATLVIHDGADSALAHWSLPAVERINPGGRPALYRPGPDADETLEIDDADMIEAIRIVGRAVAQSRPRKGRLRQSVVALTVVAIAALGLWWLPGALVSHTAKVLPPTLRAEIGQRLLKDLAPFTGKTCTNRNGLAALEKLRKAVLPEGTWNVVVVPDAPTPSALLPGNLILIRRDLIEDQPTPEAVAGAILAEATRGQDWDPLVDLLDAAGPRATFGLLTRGQIADPAIADYARTFLIRERPAPAVDATLAAFTVAGLSTRPYALAVDPTGAATLALIEADPLPGGSTAMVLDDGGWLKLGVICGA